MFHAAALREYHKAPLTGSCTVILTAGDMYAMTMLIPGLFGFAFVKLRSLVCTHGQTWFDAVRCGN